MNKSGQIPIFMLFLVAIVLVVVTLVSFFNFGRDFADRSLPVSKTMAGVQFGNDYVLSEAKLFAGEAIRTKSDNIKDEFMKAAAKRDIGVQEGGNFFAKIRDSEFSFEPVTEGNLLKIDGLFVQASSGNNQIRRDFNLCMLFNVTGNYLERTAMNGAAYAKNCAS